MKKRYTVVLDFDGVIHSYRSRWQGIDVIPDPPVEGIKEAIDRISKEYRVVIVSARCREERGITAMQAWLDKNNIIVDEISTQKPPALVYIDDRAITFDGKPELLLEKIKTFKTWY